MSISLRRQFARTFVASLSSSVLRFSLCGLVLVGVAHGQAEVQTKLGKQIDPAGSWGERRRLLQQDDDRGPTTWVRR